MLVERNLDEVERMVFGAVKMSGKVLICCLARGHDRWGVVFLYGVFGV
jgi:hypothetical protein